MAECGKLVQAKAFGQTEEGKALAKVMRRSRGLPAALGCVSVCRPYLDPARIFQNEGENKETTHAPAVC